MKNRVFVDLCFRFVLADRAVYKSPTVNRIHTPNRLSTSILQQIKSKVVYTFKSYQQFLRGRYSGLVNLQIYLRLIPVHLLII